MQRQSIGDPVESINMGTVVEDKEESQGRRDADMLIEYEHPENRGIHETYLEDQRRHEIAHPRRTWQRGPHNFDPDILYQPPLSYQQHTSDFIQHTGDRRTTDAMISNTAYTAENRPYTQCNSEQAFGRSNHIDSNAHWQNRNSRPNSFHGVERDTTNGMNVAPFYYYEGNSNQNQYSGPSFHHSNYHNQYPNQQYLFGQHMPFYFLGKAEAVNQCEGFGHHQDRHHQYHEFNQGYGNSRIFPENEIYRQQREEDAQDSLRQGYFQEPQVCTQFNMALENEILQNSQVPTTSQLHPNGQDQVQDQSNSREVPSNEEESLNAFSFSKEESQK